MRIDNTNELNKLAHYQEKYDYAHLPQNVKDAYEKEMLLRLSWNTNHLEGNTLSLDETIDVIEYDEVQSGHTYSEYREAKSAFRANHDLLNFRQPQIIDLDYIKKANAIIMNSDGAFRTIKVYIGTLAETAYLPPSPEEIPDKMEKYVKRLANTDSDLSLETLITTAAALHMDFERIHPFRDGNGRTGRLFLNQYFLNHKLPPVIIENNSRYRQAFRYYERNSDTSLMEHCLAAGLCRSYEILEENIHIL